MGAEELLSWFSKLANKIKSRFPEDYPKVLYQETYSRIREEAREGRDIIRWEEVINDPVKDIEWKNIFPYSWCKTFKDLGIDEGSFYSLDSLRSQSDLKFWSTFRENICINNIEGSESSNFGSLKGNFLDEEKWKYSHFVKGERFKYISSLVKEYLFIEGFSGVVSVSKNPFYTFIKELALEVEKYDPTIKWNEIWVTFENKNGVYVVKVFYGQYARSSKKKIEWVDVIDMGTIEKGDLNLQVWYNLLSDLQIEKLNVVCEKLTHRMFKVKGVVNKIPDKNLIDFYSRCTFPLEIRTIYAYVGGEGRREHCKLNNDCSYQGEFYKGG